MSARSYFELLKDPRWQRRKTEILTRDNFTCRSCCDTEKTLHVHHGFYVSGLAPWEYEDDCLFTICETCHEVATAAIADLRKALCRVDPDLIPAITAIAQLFSKRDKYLIPQSQLSAFAYGLSLAWDVPMDEIRAAVGDDGYLDMRALVVRRWNDRVDNTAEDVLP